MNNKHTKTCFISLITGEMQIQTVVRYHLTSIRMAGAVREEETKTQITGVGEDVEKLEPFVHCWWKYKMPQLLWKTD
jgi:hypothetical protein